MEELGFDGLPPCRIVNDNMIFEAFSPFLFVIYNPTVIQTCH
jgi:hypothetical protein